MFLKTKNNGDLKPHEDDAIRRKEVHQTINTTMSVGLRSYDNKFLAIDFLRSKLDLHKIQYAFVNIF